MVDRTTEHDRVFPDLIDVTLFRKRRQLVLPLSFTTRCRAVMDRRKYMSTSQRRLQREPLIRILRLCAVQSTLSTVFRKNNVYTSFAVDVLAAEFSCHCANCTLLGCHKMISDPECREHVLEKHDLSGNSGVRKSAHVPCSNRPSGKERPCGNVGRSIYLSVESLL